jgi:hypothetical protein
MRESITVTCGNDDTPLQTATLNPFLHLTHHRLLQQLGDCSEYDADEIMIENTYKSKTTIQVAKAVVEREPKRWRSWVCAPRNDAMEEQFAE